MANYRVHGWHDLHTNRQNNTPFESIFGKNTKHANKVLNTFYRKCIHKTSEITLNKSIRYFENKMKFKTNKNGKILLNLGVNCSLLYFFILATLYNDKENTFQTGDFILLLFSPILTAYQFLSFFLLLQFEFEMLPKMYVLKT